MARDSAGSLNGVAVAWGLTRSISGRPASSRARDAARARPAPSRSGAVRCTASEEAPKPVTKSRAAGSCLARASTAAPSPRFIPSRPCRKGRGGGEPVVARRTSNPDATNTVTSSKPPASTTSQAPRARQRTPRPMASTDDAHAPRTRIAGSRARPSARAARAIGPKYVAASRSATASPLASAAKAASAARMPPLDVPSTRPTLSPRQPGRTRSRSRAHAASAFARSAVARSSASPAKARATKGRASPARASSSSWVIPRRATSPTTPALTAEAPSPSAETAPNATIATSLMARAPCRDPRRPPPPEAPPTSSRAPARPRDG